MCAFSGVGTFLDVANTIRGFSLDKSRQLFTLSVCGDFSDSLVRDNEDVRPPWNSSDQHCEGLKEMKFGNLGGLLFINRTPDMRNLIILF